MLSSSFSLPAVVTLVAIVAVPALLGIAQVHQTIRAAAVDAENDAADWERAERVWHDPELSPKEREKVFNPDDGMK